MDNEESVSINNIKKMDIWKPKSNSKELWECPHNKLNIMEPCNECEQIAKKKNNICGCCITQKNKKQLYSTGDVTQSKEGLLESIGSGTGYNIIKEKEKINLNDNFHDPLIVEPKLSILYEVGNILKEELKPSLLEFRDFTEQQKHNIKAHGQGYMVNLQNYIFAPQRNQGWAIAPFYYNGIKYPRNAKIMQKTCECIDYIGHTRYAGIAVLHPNCGLDWHNDVHYNLPGSMVIRVFFTLKTCGGSYIEVKNKDGVIIRNYFTENKFTIFHSTNMHRVWNEGDEPRYCLVLDIDYKLPS